MKSICEAARNSALLLLYGMLFLVLMTIYAAGWILSLGRLYPQPLDFSEPQALPEG